MGLDRRETGLLLPARIVECLRVRNLEYERNKVSQPLVYQLSGRASLGRHAVRNKG